MSDEKLIRLIKKLSAMNKDNGCTEAEALLAASKIKKIKDQYNIDLKELEADEFEAIGEDVIVDYIRIPLYLQSLICYLCDAFNCKVIRNYPKNKKSVFTVVGLPHDVVMCNHFYKYLSRVLINESKGRKNKNAFCMGMIDSIMKKLMPVKEDNITVEQNAVILHRDSAINKYIAAKIGKLKNQKVYYKKNESDYNAGKAKGKNVSLSTPVQGNGQRVIGL
jgi:hypothetical protein